MKMSVKHAVSLLCGIVLLSGACSCVNDSYDINKVDTSIDIDGTVSMPVGSLGEMQLGDLLGLGTEDNEESVVRIHEDGSYYMRFAPGGSEVLTGNAQPVSEALKTGAQPGSDADINFHNVEFSLYDMPGLFSGEDVVLDLYNPILTINIDGECAQPLLATGSLVAYKGEEEIARIGIGSIDSSSPDAVVIYSGYNSIVIGRRGDSFDPTVDLATNHYIADEAFGTMLSGGADRFVIEELTFSIVADPSAPQPEDRSYSLECGGVFCSELSFGENFRLSYTALMDGIGGIDLTGDSGTLYDENGEEVAEGAFLFDCQQMHLLVDFKNSIPFDIALQAVAIDADGNLLEDVVVSMEDKNGSDDIVLAGGREGSPTSNPVVLKIAPEEEALEQLAIMDGFALQMRCATPAGFEGVALHKDQSLCLSDISLTVVNPSFKPNKEEAQ